MKFNFRKPQAYVPLITKAILLMNLSMFFMLLAFFIALNGMSITNNQRYQSVVDSVVDAFSVTIVPDGTGLGFSSAPSSERSFLEGETLARIDGLFNAQITGFKADTSRNGVMHIAVPLEELDRALRAADQVDLTQVKNVSGLQTYFLPTLVSFLKSPPPPDAAYRLDIILNSKDNPALLVNSDPAVLNDVMGQAADYAELFEKAGLAPAQLNIGVVQGDPKRADIYFRPQEASAIKADTP